MVYVFLLNAEKRKRKEEHSSRSKSYQSGGSARCRICETGADETISHVISTCQGLAFEREKILADFSNYALYPRIILSLKIS